MADNSELSIENEKSIPENSEKEETIPINEENQEANEEVVHEKPAAKARGRLAGSTDNKPRIKRVPAQQPPQQKQQQQQQQQEEEEEQAAKEKKPKKVRFQHKEEEPQPAEPDEPEEKLPPPPPKSPRTLQRERVQAAAMQRRQVAQARQDHFERTLDNFMGF